MPHQFASNYFKVTLKYKMIWQVFSQCQEGAAKTVYKELLDTLEMDIQPPIKHPATLFLMGGF